MDCRQLIVIAAIIVTIFENADANKNTLHILQNTIRNIKIINLQKSYF